MVAIVIVSHSAKLAEGVRELAEQMVQGKVPLATAGGIDDAENPLGTDAMQVYQAIESVYSEDGVLVLMDLGSALMSAEMALEFLPEAQREKVRLCEAPLVEGAIAAAVQAASGGNIERVIAEARGALAAKAAQLLGVSGNPLESPPIQEGGYRGKEIHLVIGNPQGLHARPAAKFVTTATRFQSDIQVRNLTRNTALVQAKSINQLAMLGVRQGDVIVIKAQGNDADAALLALQELVENNLGDKAVLLPSSPEQFEPKNEEREALAHLEKQEIQGIPASPGIAIGTVFLYHQKRQKVAQYEIENPSKEWQRLQIAISTAQQEIAALRQQTITQMGDNEAAIFDAHLLFLADPVLLDSVRQRIFDQGMNAEAAWDGGIEELVAAYQGLEDAYLRSRGADVADVGQRVLRLLTGTVAALPPQIPSPGILVATELTPSDIAQLNPQQVLGICTVLGTANSHSSILARSLGIPTVVGLGREILSLTEGMAIAIDGKSGRIFIQPDSVQLTDLQAQQSDWQIAQQQAREAAQHPAITRDGQAIRIVANICSVADAQAAVNLGAEGVGVLRTEFLYLDRMMEPSEEEQEAVYQAIAKILDNRPLIIRTLDIGGDKAVPYLNLGKEANPFLGWRGIRFCLDYPDLFKTQLRAILRASFGHDIKIMLPMIADMTEVWIAKEILAQAKAELRQAEIPFAASIQWGIMIEIPSAVTMAKQLATEVDFFSIGTNDLSQYAMAADRTNPRVANLADAFHPAVLRMIQQTVEAGHEAGIWVGLCGELAGDPLAIAILLGLGLDELSMSPPNIPAVKQAIAKLSLEEAKAIAAIALQQESAKAVRDYLASTK